MFRGKCITSVYTHASKSLVMETNYNTSLVIITKPHRMLQLKNKRQPGDILIVQPAYLFLKNKCSEKTTARLYSNATKSYSHACLRSPAFDADRQRLDMKTPIDELKRPPPAQALLINICRRSGWQHQPEYNIQTTMDTYLKEQKTKGRYFDCAAI